MLIKMRNTYFNLLRDITLTAWRNSNSIRWYPKNHQYLTINIDTISNYVFCSKFCMRYKTYIASKLNGVIPFAYYSVSIFFANFDFTQIIFHKNLLFIIQIFVHTGHWISEERG